MRSFLALVLAGLFAAATPCAALAHCASASAPRRCCGNAKGSCCCRAGSNQTPAQGPVTPSPRVAPDQALDVAVTSGGYASMPSTAVVAVASMAPIQFLPPAYLSACAFRC